MFRLIQTTICSRHYRCKIIALMAECVSDADRHVQASVDVLPIGASNSHAQPFAKYGPVQRGSRRRDKKKFLSAEPAKAIALPCCRRKK